MDILEFIWAGACVGAALGAVFVVAMSICVFALLVVEKITGRKFGGQ